MTKPIAISRLFRVAAISASLFAAATAQAYEVYFNDFDGGETTNGGASSSFGGYGGTITAPGFNGNGVGDNQFSGNLWQNTSGQVSNHTARSTTLTLSNLGEHSAISLDFLLAAIDSWDGNENGHGYDPDYFNVKIDGVSVFSETISNFPAEDYPQYAQSQSIGDNDNATQVIAPTTSLYGRSYWRESAYYLDFDQIAHSSSVLNIELFASGAGWQGGSDENWAIDNISVELHGTGVPSPAPWLLLAPFGWYLVRRARR